MKKIFINLCSKNNVVELCAIEKTKQDNPEINVDGNIVVPVNNIEPALQELLGHL